MSLFFFNDTATTEIYTLSLHDALPIFGLREKAAHRRGGEPAPVRGSGAVRHEHDVRRLARTGQRSEEHTSELQSRQYLVCRLLLEKKKHFSARSSLLPSPWSRSRSTTR